MWVTRNGYQPTRTSAANAERESGRGTAIALIRITNWLMQRGGLTERSPQVQEIIRIGKKQVAGVGLNPKEVGANRPDISYITLYNNNPTRVNIEIDTATSRRSAHTPRSSTDHEPRVNENDLNAINIYIVIDRWTGKVLSARRRNPIPKALQIADRKPGTPRRTDLAILPNMIYP